MGLKVPYSFLQEGVWEEAGVGAWRQPQPDRSCGFRAAPCIWGARLAVRSRAETLALTAAPGRGPRLSGPAALGRLEGPHRLKRYSRRGEG